MNRRNFIRQTTLITASLALAPSLVRAADSPFPTVRVPLARRKFTSPAVERTIAKVQAGIGNQELAWMFGNCFPKTAGSPACVRRGDAKRPRRSPFQSI